MAKWKKSTILRRARQKRRFEKYKRDLAESLARVLSHCRKESTGLYEEDHDYEIMGGR